MSIRKQKIYKMASLDVMCVASSPLSKAKNGVLGCRCVKKISIDVSLISSLLTTPRDTIETTNINNIIDNNNMKDRDEDSTDLASEEESKTVDATDDDDGEKNGYYYRNRERKLEYQKKYNREQGDKIKNYNKDYYQKRREEILEKAKTKIMCDCGCEVQLFNMNSHKKTKKHARALQRILEEKNCKLST
jgi:hypothetical protein